MFVTDIPRASVWRAQVILPHDASKRCRPSFTTAYVRAMSLRSDHKALMFLGAVAVLGAGVRVVRASSGATNAPQPALTHQSQAADSSARAGRGGRGRAGPGRGRGRSGGSTRRGGAPTADSTQGNVASRQRGNGPLDRPGYFNGKLDLDVATMAQIDSLPGVSATMARRIVADRIMRGPFITKDGLRRVTGMGPTLIAKIDSLVTFTGTIAQPSIADTVVARGRRERVGRPKPPGARRTTERRPAPSPLEVADSCSRRRARVESPPRAS